MTCTSMNPQCDSVSPSQQQIERQTMGDRTLGRGLRLRYGSLIPWFHFLCISGVLIALAACHSNRVAAQPATAVAPSSGHTPGNTTQDSALRLLPLIELPAQGTPRHALAIIISGDGGWADLDKKIGEVLSTQGVNVVGVNARSYFSKARTPENVAADMVLVAHSYMHRWKVNQLLLIGYSRGADAMPFIASRLPSDLRERTNIVAMLGLATKASFKFYLEDLIRNVSRPTDIPIAPELAKLKGMRLLCVYGTKEKDSGCRDADSSYVTIVAKSGGHHFDKNYPALATLIMREAFGGT